MQAPTKYSCDSCSAFSTLNTTHAAKPTTRTKHERMKNIASFNLDEFIEILQKIRAANGNIPVILHDQEVFVKMDCVDILRVTNGNLLLGGFHMNGKEFYDMDGFLIEN